MVYVVIDIVEDITGINTTLVVTVLCIHCILNVIIHYCQLDMPYNMQTEIMEGAAAV